MVWVTRDPPRLFCVSRHRSTRPKTLHRSTRSMTRWNMSAQSMVLSLLVHTLCLVVNADNGHEDQTAHITVAVGETLQVRSPGFPSCSRHGFVYYVSCSDPSCYLQLTAMDFDLPPGGSNFTVYSGNDTDLSLASWKQSSGTRLRLVTGPHQGPLMIILNIDSNPSQPCNYTGVKMEIASHHSVDDFKQPWTGCDPIDDVWQGGRRRIIAHQAGTQDDSRQYNCIWFLKVPPEGHGEGIGVYVRVMELHLSGEVSFRDGNSTDAPLVCQRRTNGTGSYVLRKHLTQPREGFTSMDGLVVEAIKPFTSGVFTFVYGVFKRLPPWATKCTLKYWVDDVKRPGFTCYESGWCIPVEARCDGIINCPNGEDEHEKTCSIITQRPTTSTVKATTILATSKCAGYEKLCPDGSCYYKVFECPGSSKCYHFEKLCDDGTCTSHQCLSAQTCDQKAMRSCKTGSGCYSYTGRCDGYTDCSDGSDESDCEPESKGWPWYMVLLVLGAIALLFICAICYYQRRKSSQSSSGSQRDTRAQYSGTRLQPVTAGVLPRTQTRVPSTHLIHVMADTPRAPSPRAPSPRAPSPRAPSPRAPTPRATAPIAPASSVPPPSASAPGVSLPPPSYNEALQPIYQPPGRQISTDSKEEGLPSYDSVIAGEAAATPPRYTLNVPGSFGS